MAEVFIRIKELIIVRFDLSVEELLRRAERFLEDLSRNDVLILGPAECRAFAGLDMLEIDDAEDLAVFFERRGDSWMSIPTPCPSECPNSLSYPLALKNSRARLSASLPVMPARRCLST